MKIIWICDWQSEIVLVLLSMRHVRRQHHIYLESSDMEKYSRGWRGAPAKGVGRATGARVQIPLSPLFPRIKKLFFLEKVVDR